MSLVLIDSSIWIDLLRNRTDESRLARMQSLLANREACWCGMVQLELWSGVRDSKQRKELTKLVSIVRDLEITPLIWQQANHTAALARSKGITAPASDHLIHACGIIHKVEIWHCDKHFDAIATL